MIICLCHRVSDRDIARQARAGCASFEELQHELRVGTGCGACLEHARESFHGQRARCDGACASCSSAGGRAAGAHAALLPAHVVQAAMAAPAAHAQPSARGT